MIYYIEKTISLKFDNKNQALQKLKELQGSAFIKIKEKLFPIIDLKVRKNKDGYYLFVETEFEEIEVDNI